MWDCCRVFFITTLLLLKHPILLFSVFFGATTNIFFVLQFLGKNFFPAPGT